MLVNSLYSVLMTTTLVIAQDTFYGFEAKTISQGILNFESLRGKVVLIVNVASLCGYTDADYK